MTFKCMQCWSGSGLIPGGVLLKGEECVWDVDQVWLILENWAISKPIGHSRLMCSEGEWRECSGGELWECSGGELRECSEGELWECSEGELRECSEGELWECSEGEL